MARRAAARHPTSPFSDPGARNPTPTPAPGTAPVGPRPALRRRRGTAPSVTGGRRRAAAGPKARPPPPHSAPGLATASPPAPPRYADRGPPGEGHRGPRLRRDPPRPALTIRDSCWTCPWGPRPEGRRARSGGGGGGGGRGLAPPAAEAGAPRMQASNGSRLRPALGSACPSAGALPAPRPPRSLLSPKWLPEPNQETGRPLAEQRLHGRGPVAGHAGKASPRSRRRPAPPGGRACRRGTRFPGGPCGGAGACAAAGLSSLGPVCSARRPARRIGRGGASSG